MTFKELFDQALAQCTEFKDSMDSARQEFEKHVNDILIPIVQDNKCFDRIICSIGYGRSSHPQIAMIQNGTCATSYLSLPGIRFKVKLERGAKHHSYYEDWCEYKAKSYTDVSILGMNDEQSAQTFDTMDILDVVQFVYNNDSETQANVKAREEFEAFIKDTQAAQGTLIANLIDNIKQLNGLEPRVNEYIINRVREETGTRIANW